MSSYMNYRECYDNETLAGGTPDEEQTMAKPKPSTPWNKRHLIPEEKAEITAIIEGAGPVEVIRLIGTIIANSHPDCNAGCEIRGQLFKIARSISDNH